MQLIESVKPVVFAIEVHLVLHPHGIEPTFLKLNSWFPGMGFHSYNIQKGNKSDKKGKF